MDIIIKMTCTFLLLNILACRNETGTSHEKKISVLTDSIISSKEYDLHSQVILLDRGHTIGPLTDFSRINDSLFFFEQIVYNDCFGALVDLKDRAILNKIGRMGKGPFELVSLFDYYKSQDSLFFFDYISERLLVTQIDALIDTAFLMSHENSQQFRISPSFPVDILMLINNKWVTKNYDFTNTDSSLVELASNTLVPVKYFGSLPLSRDNDPKLRLVENLANGTVRPDGERFVLAYKFRDLIEIYNSDGRIQKSIFGPQNEMPILSESTIRRFDPIPIVNKTWYAYSKIVATDSCFYVGYIGKKEPPLSVYTKEGYIEKEYNTSSFSNILKFDWAGNLLVNYQLDESISYFEMGGENDVIYATSGYIDEGLYKFSLN